jgi:hypothetical protein
MLKQAFFMHHVLGQCPAEVRGQVRVTQLKSTAMGAGAGLLAVFVRGRTTLFRYGKGLLVGAVLGLLNSYHYTIPKVDGYLLGQMAQGQAE